MSTSFVPELRITLIRHGETPWNASGRWQGHADVPLSARGVEQAHQLAARLQADRARFDLLYASDLQRASATASVLAAALGLQVQPLPGLREVHLGIWSGLTTTEIQSRYAVQWDAVPLGGRRGEHGESDAMFDARVTAALQHLARTHPGQRIAVVTHGGTIKCALRNLIGPVSFPEDFIRNTSLTTLSTDGEHWRLLTFNDYRHLDAAPVPDETL
ncbi:MAG: histidine phosphatase family protein [Herpetosiphon sp.]